MTDAAPRPVITGPDLRAWRAAHGLTQVRAAELMGVTRRTYQLWEDEAGELQRVVQLATRALDLDLRG